jgi:hypothetical protein
MYLSLRLINHHSMKTYGGVDISMYAFLTSTPDGGEWLASRPGRYNPGKTAQVKYSY